MENQADTVMAPTAEVTATTVVTAVSKSKVVFPDGEFTTKQLMSASGLTQPAVHSAVVKAVQAGTIKEVRRERLSNKGRSTIIYAKVV